MYIEFWWGISSKPKNYVSYGYKLWEWEVIKTSSAVCSVFGFDVNCVKPLGSVAR